MKNYFNKGWKKVFLIIGIALIVVDLFFIITTPTTITQQYLEYGPNIESDVFDKTGDVTEKIEDSVDDVTSGEDSSIVSDVSNETGMSPTLTKSLLFIGGAILIVLAISAVTDSDGGGSKKK